jgi:hypothetical protein
MAMGKYEDGQREYFYNETNSEHFQGWYGGLQFGNAYTCNELFKEHVSLKKLILEYFSQAYWMICQ